MNATAAALIILLERIDTLSFAGLDRDSARHLHDRLMRAAIELDAAMINAGHDEWRDGLTFRVVCT